jgi:hypothetical protein
MKYGKNENLFLFHFLAIYSQIRVFFENKPTFLLKNEDFCAFCVKGEEHDFITTKDTFFSLPPNTFLSRNGIFL